MIVVERRVRDAFADGDLAGEVCDRGDPVLRDRRSHELAIPDVTDHELDVRERRRGRHGTTRQIVEHDDSAARFVRRAREV